MNLHPMSQIVKSAEGILAQGGSFFQQFLCSTCGVKQTMAEENRLFTHGLCEECGATTDIMKNGANLLAVFGPGATHGKG